MKKKILTIMIIGMMAVSLVACGDNKEVTTSSNNNKTVTSNSNEDSDNNKEKDAEDNNGTVKVTEDELKKINNENIERLKAFYDKNGLPYATDNLYNNSVDEARIFLVTSKVESQGIDTKGISQIEYQYVNNFTIQADITCMATEGESLDLNNSLSKEYVEAIVNEDIDFSEIESKLEEYYKNFSEGVSKRFAETIETEAYKIELAAITNERYVVSIYSKFELKN